MLVLNTHTYVKIVSTSFLFFSFFLSTTLVNVEASSSRTRVIRKLILIVKNDAENPREYISLEILVPAAAH